MFVEEPTYRASDIELDHLPVEMARQLARANPNTWRVHAAELRSVLPIEEFDYISGAPAISKSALNKMRAYQYLLDLKLGKKVAQEYLINGKWEAFSDKIFNEKEARVYDLNEYRRPKRKSRRIEQHQIN